mmetsp:Transcript_11126/g.29582  ORF Transcript_11126/g.29582 Transcript_11126/m.29582 type:complete len:223 (-) Transcript_11126:2-670(-)
MAGDSLPLVLSGCTHGNHRHPELRHVVCGVALECREVRLDRGAHANHAAEHILLHDREAQGRHRKAAAGVDLRDQVVLVHRGSVYPVPPQRAGIVDEDVDTPEGLHRHANTLLDVVQAPHVDLHRKGLYAKSHDLICDGIDRTRQRRLGRRGLRRDDDVAALLCQRNGARLSDSTRRARDDGDLPAEVRGLELGAQRSGTSHRAREAAAAGPNIKDPKKVTT